MNKNQQFLFYIISKRLGTTITEIVKLAYLIELSFYREYGERITNYRYIRYYYGPYDKKIDEDVQSLVIDKKVNFRVFHTMYGENIAYYIDPQVIMDNEESFSHEITHKEQDLIDGVLKQLDGFGSIQLTKIAYQSNPMKKLNATLGGNENLLEELDFDA